MLVTFFNSLGGYMSTAAKIKSKHKVMHKQGCFYPEPKFPGLDRFSGRLIYRNGKTIGKQLKCTGCDNAGKYFKKVESIDNNLGIPNLEYLDCHQPFCNKGYSKKLYSVRRSMYKYQGFTCPKCGSHYFGTSKSFSDKQLYGHCNGDNCNFKWRRSFRKNSGLQNKISDYSLEKLAIHEMNKKEFMQYMTLINKGNEK